MKKILLFSIILFFTSFCKSTDNRNANFIENTTNFIEKIKKHPYWSACFTKDLSQGGVTPKSIKHAINFTIHSDTTFSLSWTSTAYSDASCTQELQTLNTSNLILDNISIQTDDNFFSIGKNPSGKPKHTKTNEIMMPPFSNFENLNFMLKNFLVHFKITNEELKIFYKENGGEFNFASPNEPENKFLSFK